MLYFIMNRLYILPRQINGKKRGLPHSMGRSIESDTRIKYSKSFILKRYSDRSVLEKSLWTITVKDGHGKGRSR
jgi:hypothetical protein